MAETDKQANRWMLRSQAVELFPPSAPIHRLAIFRGRQEQISEALEAISQPGQHPVIYGEPGVGKTSLVSVLGEILEKARVAGWKLIETCQTDDSFDSMWRRAFQQLIVTDNDEVVPETRTHQLDLGEPTRLSEWFGSSEITPDQIARVSMQARGHIIVIFDEFNLLLGRDEIMNRMANTVKLLSDRRATVTIIIVGVADSIDELLAQHASTERNFIQVKMPRMAPHEVGAILTEGLRELGMTVDSDAISFLQSLVQGLPSPTHRISLQCAYRLIDSGRTGCTRDDVKEALVSAIRQMPESLMRSWDDATESYRSHTLFKHVLLACALTKRNDLGWFAPADALIPFRAVTSRNDYVIGTYSQHLHLLADTRGAVLEKELRGSTSNRYRFRFRNPLFQSYVVMRCLADGDLTEDQLEQFRANLPA